MPINLTITCDNADQLVDEFKRLNDLTTSGPSTTLDNIPLDAMIERVRERLKEQGFKLEVVEDQRQAVEPIPEAPPAPSKSKAKKAAKPNGADQPPATLEPEPKTEPDPESDRQHVMDTLSNMRNDPALKDKVLAFARIEAQKYGKTLLGDLPPEPFIEIRQAMQKEFDNA